MKISILALDEFTSVTYSNKEGQVSVEATDWRGRRIEVECDVSLPDNEVWQLLRKEILEKAGQNPTETLLSTSYYQALMSSNGQREVGRPVILRNGYGKGCVAMPECETKRFLEEKLEEFRKIREHIDVGL